LLLNGFVKKDKEDLIFCKVISIHLHHGIDIVCLKRCSVSVTDTATQLDLARYPCVYSLLVADSRLIFNVCIYEILTIS